jgi:hypothetical protein
VDDNDSLHTKHSGTWHVQTAGGYGPSWLTAPITKLPIEITYKPQVQVPGNYMLYAYMPVVESAATQTHYIIKNGATIKNVFVAPHKNVEGQTSGE